MKAAGRPYKILGLSRKLRSTNSEFRIRLERERQREATAAMKRAVALMMMVFLIVARAEELGVDPLRDSGRKPDKSFEICIPQCAISCILKLRWFPIAYGICFGLCMIGCKATPSDAVYGCTSTCAYSHKSSPQPVTDLSSAESYVNWCYENCKKE